MKIDLRPPGGAVSWLAGLWIVLGLSVSVLAGIYGPLWYVPAALATAFPAA
jgi:hypothetical protein